MDLVTPGLGLIFWQTALFLITLFLLGKFAWKPILSALGDRERAISSALESAKDAKLEMENLKSENEKLLQEARIERDKILKDAQNASISIVEDAKLKATAESNRIIENAKNAINIEKQAALTEVRNIAGTLSIEIAEKLLLKELQDKKAQKDLVEAYLKGVKLS